MIAVIQGLVADALRAVQGAFDRLVRQPRPVVADAESVRIGLHLALRRNAGGLAGDERVVHQLLQQGDRPERLRVADLRLKFLPLRDLLH